VGFLPSFFEGARRRNLSVNSLAAYERTWKPFLAWAAAASIDQRNGERFHDDEARENSRPASPPRP
jgi:hypothetical protein